MVMLKVIAVWLLAAAAAMAALAQQNVAAPKLSAAQIVEKNVVARGGTDAWRKINSMAWTGHVESASEPDRKMAFLLEQRRPGQVRFEISAAGQKSVRIYNGTEGWKMRATSSGKPELQPYTADELEFARGAQVIEGPLMDFVAKQSVITLAGIEAVEGRLAYVLEVKPPLGETHRVWVDAETFLETRLERRFHTAAGQAGVSTVEYRDYRPFEGLQLPVTIETGPVSGKSAARLVIERVALNPPLDEHAFDRPIVPLKRRMGSATVDTRGAAAANPARPAAPP
ncbi:MAG: hypothetical protein WCH35_17880 [Comamonadaceae bacterium]